VNALVPSILSLLVADADAATRDPRVGADARAVVEGRSQDPAARTPTPRLPALAYSVPRRPEPRRTQAWTRPRTGFAPSWERDYPEMHFSRFLDLARPQFHPPKIRELAPAEWRVALFRFANAVTSDLADAIEVACPKRRCAPILAEARERARDFGRGGIRGFTYVAHPPKSDPFDGWYGWKLTHGAVSFDLGCIDLREAPEVSCRLDLELSNDLTLQYLPRNPATGPRPEIRIRHNREAADQAVGEIQFHRTYSGAPVVIITGAALAHSPSP
jgi:hypothetical protein